MVVEMQHLVTHADVITPNLTELFYLLDRPYKESNTDQELKRVFALFVGQRAGSGHYHQCTGVGRTPQNFCLCLQSDRKPLLKITCPYLPAHYPGTGDTFTSVIPELIAGRQSSHC